MKPQALIIRAADRYGESWLVYTRTARNGLTLFLACPTLAGARRAADRALRECGA